MTEPFLIAHKVRGEPAFDIAHRVSCPECEDHEGTNQGCNECDQLGYWWLVSTSGHRAYPYWHYALLDLFSHPAHGSLNCREMIGTDECPPDLPDHYPTRAAPTLSLADANK